MSKRLSIRLVAGVWCLAAFIFVQAYSSILFTYVVTPVNLPLVNSVYDIVDRNDIRLFLNKGMALDVFTSVSLHNLFDVNKDYSFYYCVAIKGTKRDWNFFQIGQQIEILPQRREMRFVRVRQPNYTRIKKCFRACKTIFSITKLLMLN
jgi:hypothetical protein